MKHRFHEGAVVALRTDYFELGLKAGTQGTVWCLYDLETPEYEVTFRDKEGRDFDLTLCEEEISAPLSLGETGAMILENGFGSTQTDTV